MRATALLREILGQVQTRVVDIELTEYGLMVDVAPTWSVPRCGECGRKCHRIHGERPRTWRHLDLGGMETELRYSIRRVICKHCGGTRTEQVPWAAAGSNFTYDFEQTVALLAQRMDKTSVSHLLRIAWETVGGVVARFVARVGPKDLLDDLTHIGIDEISYKRHHHYLTVVTDHTRSRVVWVGKGKSAATLREFIAELGERASKIAVVSIDMSAAYAQAIREGLPNAELVFDRFHVQRLVHDALDEVRRGAVRQASGEERKGLKKTRWALQKNPWNLNAEQKAKLSDLQKTNKHIYRGYLLKESLCDILDHRQHNVQRDNLARWISWALRSRLEPFVRVAKTIRKHADGIVAYVRTRVNNGRSEGMNGKVRTITKRSYGFHSAHAVIAYIFLCCTGIRIAPVVKLPRAG